MYANKIARGLLAADPNNSNRLMVCDRCGCTVYARAMHSHINSQECKYGAAVKELKAEGWVELKFTLNIESKYIKRLKKFKRHWETIWVPAWWEKAFHLATKTSGVEWVEIIRDVETAFEADDQQAYDAIIGSLELALTQRNTP